MQDEDRPPLRVSKRSAFGAMVCCLLLTGCAVSAQSPDFLLLNSYFPSWLIGVFIAIPLTVLIRFGLIKAGIDDFLPFRFFVYVCIWLIIAMIFSYIYSPR